MNNLTANREIFIFAFRYALGRMSHSSYIVTEAIKDNIEKISDNDIKLYIREIKEYEERDLFKDELDKSYWIGFSKYLENKLNER